MTELEAKTLCVDIDATICTNSGDGDYAGASPIPGAQESLDQLRAQGWVVVLHTARHFNNWQVTVDWLERHGFTYDQLVFGKPPGRYYVDDRAIPFEGDWDDVRRKIDEAAART